MDLVTLLREAARSDDPVQAIESIAGLASRFFKREKLDKKFEDFTEYDALGSLSVPEESHDSSSASAPPAPVATKVTEAPRAPSASRAEQKAPKAKAHKASKSPEPPAPKATPAPFKAPEPPVKAAAPAPVALPAPKAKTDSGVRKSRSRTPKGAGKVIRSPTRSQNPATKSFAELHKEPVIIPLEQIPLDRVTQPQKAGDPDPMEAEFQVAMSRKQKRKRARAASEARKSDSSSPSSPRSKSPAAKKPVPRDQAPRAPPSQTPGGPGRKDSRLDFVILSDKTKWFAVAKVLQQRGIKWVSAQDHEEGVKIQLRGSDDYRECLRLLVERKDSHRRRPYDYERDFRVVIRGIPKEFPESEVMASLLEQGIQVRSVHRLRNKRKGAYDIVLVKIDPTSESCKTIFTVKEVCMLVGIRVERPHKRVWIGQCHRCQHYGHSQKGCFAPWRCVKCLLPHSTNDCKKPKGVPPSCVLCGQSGHTANWLGCPKAPKVRQRVERPKVSVKPKGPVVPQRNSRNFPELSAAPQKGRYLPPSADAAPRPAPSAPQSQQVQTCHDKSKRAARAVPAKPKSAFPGKSTPQLKRANAIALRQATIEEELKTAKGPSALALSKELNALYRERCQLLESSVSVNSN